MALQFMYWVYLKTLQNKFEGVISFAILQARSICGEFLDMTNFKQQILSWESIEIGIVLINKPKQKNKQTASLRHKDTRCAKIVSRTSLQS